MNTPARRLYENTHYHFPKRAFVRIVDDYKDYIVPNYSKSHSREDTVFANQKHTGRIKTKLRMRLQKVPHTDESEVDNLTQN